MVEMSSGCSPRRKSLTAFCAADRDVRELAVGVVDQRDVVGDGTCVERGQDAERFLGGHVLGLAGVLEGEPHLGAVSADGEAW